MAKYSEDDYLIQLKQKRVPMLGEVPINPPHNISFIEEIRQRCGGITNFHTIAASSQSVNACKSDSYLFTHFKQYGSTIISLDANIKRVFKLFHCSCHRSRKSLWAFKFAHYSPLFLIRWCLTKFIFMTDRQKIFHFPQGARMVCQ